MKRSRRSILQACAGTVGVGALCGLAGCFGQQPGPDEANGDSGDAGDGSTAGGENADGGDGIREPVQADDLWYTKRLPAPDALGYDHYGFEYTAMADLLAHTDDTGIAAPKEIETEGFSFSNVTHILVIAPKAIDGPSIGYNTGRVDPREYVEGNNVPRVVERGERHGLTLWGPETDGEYAVGGDEETLVRVHDRHEDPVEALTAVVDAAAGETPRYTDVDAECRRLVEALGSGLTVHGRRREPTDDLPGLVGEGVSLALGEAEAQVRASFLFADEGAVSSEDAASWAASAWAFDEPTAAAVETDGPLATVERTMALGEVESAQFDFPTVSATRAERERAVPAAMFEFEYKPDTDADSHDRDGRLTVTHASGDTIRADRLVIDGPGIADGGDVDQAEAGPWQGSTSSELGDQPAVSAGDSVTVAVTDDYVIRVVYVDGRVARELGRHEGPAA